MTEMIIFIVLVVCTLLWVAMVYNRLIKLRNLKEEGWSGIDVQLKRRHDLVANLVATVKKFMSHEKDILEEVTKIRADAISQSAGGAMNAGRAEGELSQALGRLFSIMETYPDIKANTNVLSMQEELSALEHTLQSARRYYNATVRDLNIKIESFPSNLIAGKFGFTKAEYFEITNPGDREAVVSFDN